MGVEKVNHPQVVARFILPELQSVPSGDRKRLLDHVRQHWNTLKLEQAIIDTLREVLLLDYTDYPRRGEGGGVVVNDNMCLLK